MAIITKNKEGIYLPQVSREVIKQFRGTETNSYGEEVAKFSYKEDLKAVVPIPSLLQTAEAIILSKHSFILGEEGAVETPSKLKCHRIKYVSPTDTTGGSTYLDPNSTPTDVDIRYAWVVPEEFRA